MADRKLAYIATIANIEKIPDKDRIVYASLKDLGWQVIVDVSYHVGDKVVYVEIDSVLPIKPEYEFLRKRCYSDKWNGFIIKGMRMAGLVSYGLVLPVPATFTNKPDGFDMSDVLEIRKREDDIPEAQTIPKTRFDRFIGWLCWKLGIKRKRKAIGVVDGWLSFAHKTDETRIENLSYLFSDKFKGTPVYTTVKCDGQSATFAVYKKYFFMASRNVILYRQPVKRAIRELNPKTEKPSMDNFRKIAARYDIPRKMNQALFSGSGLVIQGELCGPGIQKNPMGLPNIDLFIFNVSYPAVKSNPAIFVSWDAILSLCGLFGLKTVPFIEKRLFDWPDKAALKEYAKGQYSNGKDREGVVIRYDSGSQPMPEALQGMSNMWSFKCINDDYLLS